MRQGSNTRFYGAAVTALAAAVWLGAPVAHGQAPDARSMSGLAMPTADLPDGTVSVRVVRGGMSNNLQGVRVELHGAGANRTAVSGEDGRAQFSGLPPGSSVHAHATHEGEQLETDVFDVPATGGVRALLVFSEPGQAAATPAPHGGGGAPFHGGMGGGNDPLSIGGNSRIALEFREDVLQVFYLLQILNRTSEPITPPSALIFDMPRGAEGTTLLEGATRQANARGTRVTVTGPFPPGVTELPIAFRLDAFGSTLSIEQRFPLPFEMMAIAVQKVGDMQVASPQIARMQDAPIESALFVMGTGPRLEAGQPFSLQLAGVPHQNRTPVYLALALAGLIVAIATWIALKPGRLDAVESRRQTLEARRERELAALAALDQQYRTGSLDEARYARRREATMAQLERIYGELDVTGDASGGQGAAA
jgi:hypothetical protein